MKTNTSPSNAKLTKLIIRWSCLWFAFLVFAGCRSGNTKEATGDIAGVYTLVSVDGKQLPYTVGREPGSPQVRSGTFTILEDGTCISKIAFALPTGQASTREVKATYTREGQTLKMNWQGAGQTTGTIQGGTFLMGNEGTLFTYKKGV